MLEPQHLSFIDAMRGWAILGVILVHTAALFPGLSGAFKQLANEGARGVQLFFVFSALTLMMSWRTRQEPVAAFYTRRLFRIAPLFWLAIVGFLALDGFAPRYWAPGGLEWWHVAVTALFIHGWHPQTVSSVVPGGWSIAVEMTFYAVFPIIAGVCFTFRRAVIAILAALIFAKVASGALGYIYVEHLPSQPHGLIKSFQFLSFFSQLPVFLIGIATYHAITQPVPASWSRPPMFVCAALAALLAMPFLDSAGLGVINKLVPRHILYALAFALLIFGLARGNAGDGVARLLVNAPLRFLGRISFSMYLIHFAVMDLVATKLVVAGINPFGLPASASGFSAFLLFFACILGVTSGLSTLSFAAIEAPMIALGAKTAKRFHQRQMAPTAVASRR